MPWVVMGKEGYVEVGQGVEEEEAVGALEGGELVEGTVGGLAKEGEVPVGAMSQ